MSNLKPDEARNLFIKARANMIDAVTMINKHTPLSSLEEAYNRVRKAEGKVKIAQNSLRALKFKLKDEINLINKNGGK